MQYTPILHKINYTTYELSVLRLDLIHPEISGNKWFKLKYNLQQAKAEGKNTIITFGGAFSNHIAATAYACKEARVNSIGIIRGEESSQNNPTLLTAKKNGMNLRFVSREEYKLKNNKEYIRNLQIEYQNSYIIPEGGDNEYGQKGCEEILSSETNNFDLIFCAYGTGTTFKGLAHALQAHQQLIGVNVLKYEAETHLSNTTILNTYHFGGYAKHTKELLDFKIWFEEKFTITLDYVYTAKLFYAVFDMIKQNKIDKSKKILIIHSGGLQGNTGYENRYNLNPNRQVNDAHG